MSIKIVDTNVAVAANGRNTHADEHCQLACIEALERFVRGDKIAIDDQSLILEEYARHLTHSGEPGVGDKFFKHVFDNQYVGAKCVRVTIHPDPGGNSFREFPENPALRQFDPSDRKFVAVALTVGEKAPILNATDSDWDDYEAPLVFEGIIVTQLCPQHANKINRQG